MAASSISVDKKRSANLKWLGKLLRQLAFFALLLLLWQGLAVSHIWKDYLFPGPLTVLDSLKGLAQDGSLLTAILVSLRRLALGYGLSLVLGLILGLLISSNRYIEETLGSLVLGLQALPSVCWIPLALLWFGLHEQAMIFVVIMGALFSITLGVDAGIKNTPPVYLKAARNMGSRGFALATQVILPAALPSILTGLKQGWTFAWRSLMAAELLYTTVSLGALLESGRDFGDVGQLFAIMLVIIILGVAIDSLIFGPFERMVRKRWGLAR
ncbi:ABC transporter permease [Dictyobacter aurantiacus]|uniref:Sulfate ABC transporter permease n=1 Tax=Dictyobacter aurantiacus TaxID=1936993 RepID=A0A401ZJ35_9CHLR|nr:ABC transporter permease [Dictyobacter aurantiacus]GCE06871.1 sulfate ABC transporter permease [Dictyobacter aurantiacus]